VKVGLASSVSSLSDRGAGNPDSTDAMDTAMGMDEAMANSRRIGKVNQSCYDYFMIRYLVQKITSPIVDHGWNASTPLAVWREGSTTEGNITSVS